jgi:hypothetical protein
VDYLFFNNFFAQRLLAFTDSACAKSVNKTSAQRSVFRTLGDLLNELPKIGFGQRRATIGTWRGTSHSSGSRCPNHSSPANHAEAALTAQ